MQNGSHIKYVQIEAKNLSSTPHGVTLHTEDDAQVAFFPSGNLLGVWDADLEVKQAAAAYPPPTRSSVVG
jgi:hypothetical protein